MISTPLLLGLKSTRLSDAEREAFQQIRPSGYLLLERNLENPEQVRELTDSLGEIDPGLTPIIAGSPASMVRILPPTPSSAALAACGRPARVADCSAFTADLLRLLGINLYLAPRLDLGPAGDPGSWHSDPMRVIDHAGMWNRWLRKHKVRSAAGHFPAGGRGDDASVTLSELLAGDLITYTALMPELDAIVVGHQVLESIDPGQPASCSTRIVTRLLRDQLGFDHHLVLTDDLSRPLRSEGHGVSEALRAGVDLAVWAQNPNPEAALAGIDKVPAPLLQDSERRLERFRKKLHDPLPWSPERWSETCAKLPPPEA